jgi:hypothetical protein
MTRTRSESAPAPSELHQASTLATAFSTLLGLPDDLLSGRTQSDLADARDRLAQGRCNVVVLGEFKRGKARS